MVLDQHPEKAVGRFMQPAAVYPKNTSVTGIAIPDQPGMSGNIGSHQDFLIASRIYGVFQMCQQASRFLEALAFLFHLQNDKSLRCLCTGV